MKKSFAIPACTLVAAMLLASCASPGYYGQGNSQPVSQAYPLPAVRQSYPASASNFSSYGTIDSIRMSQTASTGSGVGTGAVVGGIVGGLLGNQVGGGRGRAAATIAGVVGGAMVGDQIEQRNAQLRDSYQIGVRLDNGGYQTITQDNVAGLQVGSRVRIDNERVYRY